MIDVKSKTCRFENCRTRPVFNLEGEKQALYCFLHKENNMIDIKNKTCRFENCKKQPVFNLEGGKQALYCFLHKENNMIDVRSKKCLSSFCETHVSKKYNGYCYKCFLIKKFRPTDQRLRS